MFIGVAECGYVRKGYLAVTQFENECPYATYILLSRLV
jgi:hypothetical protein